MSENPRRDGERGLQSGLEPIAVIDIGSNSVRLVVYEGAIRASAPLFNEKVLCGLGRQLASTGHLGEEAVERALVALARFRAIARILRVKNIRAIATAACRDAGDGPDFIVRGEKELGTAIQVLSGQQEAELAAKGIMMGFRSPDGVAGDLGGGSLELIDVSGNVLNQAVTLPLGGLRLIDTSGGEVRLSQHRGQVVVLDFWCTWSPLCRETLPLVQKLHERFAKDERVTVFGLAVEEREGSDPEAFLRQAGCTYALLLNGERAAGLFGITLKVRASAADTWLTGLPK